MLQQTIERTWEEILEHNAELIGQRVRLGASHLCNEYKYLWR
jgi:hypothetical protein